MTNHSPDTLTLEAGYQPEQDTGDLLPTQIGMIVIKPGFERHTNDIVNDFGRHGLVLFHMKNVSLSEKAVEILYPDQKEQNHFDKLTEYLTSDSVTFLMFLSGPRTNAPELIHELKTSDKPENNIRNKYSPSQPAPREDHSKGDRIGLLVSSVVDNAFHAPTPHGENPTIIPYLSNLNQAMPELFGDINNTNPRVKALRKLIEPAEDNR